MNALVKRVSFLVLAVATLLLLTLVINRDAKEAVAIVRFLLNMAGGYAAIAIAKSLKGQGGELGVTISAFCLGAGLYNLISGLLFLTSSFVGIPGVGYLYFLANTTEVVPLLALYHLIYKVKEDESGTIS